MGPILRGVSIKDGIKYVTPDGQAGQVVFLAAAHVHLTPEEFGDLVERLGHPRPDPPFGLTEVEALDVAQVTELAGGDPNRRDDEPAQVGTRDAGSDRAPQLALELRAIERPSRSSRRRT